MKCTVHNIVDQPDGSALADVEYDDEFADMACRWASRERKDEVVEMFILQALEDKIKESNV